MNALLTFPSRLPGREARVRLCSTKTPNDTHNTFRTILLKASRTLDRHISRGVLKLPFPPRIVHLFFVWIHYGRKFLDLEQTVGLREARVVRLPRGLLYDIIADIDLAHLYILSETFHISALKNDVITQLILQSHVADTTVDNKAVDLVYQKFGRENPFLAGAVRFTAHSIIKHGPLSNAGIYSQSSKALEELLRVYTRYKSFIAAGQRVYTPAHRVCCYHQHMNDVEALDCRNNQEWLGLPVLYLGGNGRGVLINSVH